MKRSAILLVLVLTALLAACTKSGTPAVTPATTSGTTTTSTPVPTTPPDFSDIDFSGTWTVSALFDSGGQTVSEEEISALGADFTLELTSSSDYFIYDSQGALIGQGEYTVSLDEVILSAGNQQTVYGIQDADTLRCMAGDGSVTVMKRLEETEETEEETEASSGDVNTEEVPEG